MNSNKSLGICIYGGLGNQLFSMCAGISKALDENRNFIIYACPNNLPYRHFYFDLFLNKVHNKVIYKIIWTLENVYEEKALNIYEEIPNNTENIRGLFLLPKYFYHNKKQIINILGLDPYINKYNINHLFNNKVIGIHFRLEDHITLGFIKPSEYYINSIKKIRELLNDDKDNYTYLIFSTKNDDEYVNKYINDINTALNINLNFVKIYNIISSNIDYEELFYMSNCNHLIISNSTFSLFAAYLNNNDNKIVIYDKLFIKTTYFFDNWYPI
jgi:hypothetical protein